MKRLVFLGVAGLALAGAAPAAHACWDGGFGYTPAGDSYAPGYRGYGYTPFYSSYYGPRRGAYGYAPYDDSYYYGPGIGIGISAVRVGRIDRGDRVVGRAYAPRTAAVAGVSRPSIAGRVGAGGSPRGMGAVGVRGGGLGRGR